VGMLGGKPRPCRLVAVTQALTCGAEWPPCHGARSQGGRGAARGAGRFTPDLHLIYT
jgi:hypothetical protein